MLLKQMKVFMEKIVHYGCLFVCKKFHEQIPIKTYICYSFYYVSILMTSSCKLENILQSTIALFKCASISQHNKSLRYYAPLIA